MVMAIVSSCINFIFFSFVMVSNNKKCCTIFGCYVASVTNNFNIPMDAILTEIFLSVYAAAVDDGEIRCRPPLPAAAPKTFLTDRTKPQNTLQVHVIFGL